MTKLGASVFLGQRPLVPFLLLSPPFFSNYSFWVHHLVNRYDRHLLAHAMASDFSVAWQCLSKRTIVFSLQIKLHAQLGASVIILPMFYLPFRWSYLKCLTFPRNLRQRGTKKKGLICRLKGTQVSLVLNQGPASPLRSNFIHKWVKVCP
jgi:hypothetical protein